ncbi:hypothetical protein S23_30550 [Bradyrhizobium cosmicum]|uniref:Uncharacterized protein n=1 Tax=Bradyrhizobium cosmicum TaxID=1404864 RepID=A0AAI8MCU9_9BRAD|nr:hypothetical protein S23_30550 [Bradyrhizobium cosmicum]
MAQAFKFPTEANNGLPRDRSFRSLAQAHRLVGSPLPTDPVKSGSIASNMGLPPSCRKRCKDPAFAAAALPIPGPGDPVRG